MHVWKALHSSYDGGPRAISIHYTRKGAEAVIKKSKAMVKKDFHELYGRYKGKERRRMVKFRWYTFHWWGAQKVEVKN